MSRPAEILYFSYPISGLDIAAVRAQAEGRRILVERNLPDVRVVLPQEIQACPDCSIGNDTPTHEHTWSEWMRADIYMLLQCDAIVMCPGWEHSKGASLEMHVAVNCGLKVYFLRDETDLHEPYLLKNGRTVVLR